MAPPLSDDQVTYDDGAPQTVDQYSRDVSAFLMWAAEPHLEDRKKTGFRVMIFLVLFAGAGLPDQAQGLGRRCALSAPRCDRNDEGRQMAPFPFARAGRQN